jgi:hypothetical protein
MEQLKLIAIALAANFAVVASGQPVSGVGSFRPDRGFLPTGAYGISGIESINETSGAVGLNIPLGQLPPGRAGMTHGVGLVYNSDLYDVRTREVYPPEVLAPESHIVNAVEASQSGGWRYAFRYAIEVEVRDDSVGRLK